MDREDPRTPPAPSRPAGADPPRDDAAVADAATLPAAAETDDASGRSQQTTVRGSDRSGFPDELVLEIRDPERYQRGPEIARGGMGRIVSLYDRQLRREIAIKELRSSSPELARRFAREVEITARLQHPSIIGLIEAGRWPSGEPFFLMKRVDGRAFDSLIAEARSLADRLRLLPNVVAAADALAYAHSQGIVHRDLKPANVLAGPFGETVVIDWGLAKDLASPGSMPGGGKGSGRDDEQDLTLVGDAIGTPAYMPPEQARGQEVDQRADVYALGAMLYHLLAGTMPYRDGSPPSVDELLERVRSSSPTPLVELEPRVPPDLATIVSKAMARDPKDRYPDAGALADDLKRFSTGHLVAAHHYSSWQLAKRWFGRHRAVVGVACSMILLLIAGAIVSFARIARERDRAEHLQAAAEENRAQVEGMLDFMIGDLSEKLAPIARLDLLGMVADKAAAYYRDRPIDWSRPESAASRIAVHITVGDLLHLKGDLVGALDQYREGVAIARRLVELEPDDLKVPWDLSTALERLGWVLLAHGEPAGAETRLGESLRLRQRMLARAPDRAKWQEGLALVHEELGEVVKGNGDLAAALEHDRAALAIRQRLAQQAPDNVERQRMLAADDVLIGTVLSEQGDLDGALARHRGALAIRVRLAEARPGDAIAQQEVAESYAKIGAVLHRQDRLDDAQGQYRAALAIREELVRRDPGRSGWQRDLAYSLGSLGILMVQRGDLAGAQPLLKRSSDLYATYALLANDFYNAACMSAVAGDSDRAFELLDTAVERGWRRVALMQEDGDLSSLRRDPRWSRLIEKIGSGEQSGGDGR